MNIAQLMIALQQYPPDTPVIIYAGRDPEPAEATTVTMRDLEPRGVVIEAW